MSYTILDTIPIAFAADEVMTRMRLPADNPDLLRSVTYLVELAQQVARPKALYGVRFVERRDENSLEIGGVTFTSRVLRKNLDTVERVFPYVATCGRELEEVDLPADDFMAPYIMDAIKAQALGAAITYLFDHLRRKYALGKTAKMNPGSLPDWPLTEQVPLFSLFGNVEDLIGVRLTDSCLMFPVKSVSGLLFPTEVTFESCQLCRREVCAGRRAAFEPEMAERYGV
jgi:hypothetical protein